MNKKEQDNTVITAMTQHEPIIIINKENKNPVFRMLVQTPNELPAYDMGLNSIRFTREAIEKGLNRLEGTFVYDETQSRHNKKLNPEMRGRKVAKVIKSDYCPSYGGYVDVESFDNEFTNTLYESLDNTQRGLPVHEGPSTELDPLKVERYGDNNLEVSELMYKGLVWIENPRDKSLGICDVVNNSIIERLEEADNVPEKEIIEVKESEMVTLTIEQYEQLKKVEQDYKELKPEDFTEYQDLQKQLEEVSTEKEDLHAQLVPVWTKQGEQKMEMVNSILESLPEAEREGKLETFEKMDVATLETIVNTIPKKQERGVADGAKTTSKLDEEQEEIEATLDKMEKLGLL